MMMNTLTAIRRYTYFALVCLVFVPTAQREASENPHGDLSQQCSDCHTTAGWSPLIEPLLFDHSSTDFPLYGEHTNVGCSDCHGSLVFSEAESHCFSCHEIDFRETIEPDHSNFAGFSTSCEECHSETTWQSSSFDHNVTAFQLLGAHRITDCVVCHQDGFTGTPTDCFSCHQADYDDAIEPDHQGFPITCEDCHSESTWQSAAFDHNLTAFPLFGAHRGIGCNECHSEGFSGTPTDCFSCHQADYDGATDPDHLGFPITCEDCHSESAWVPANFDHALTAFPLDGAHLTLDCLSCHASGYQGTPTDCFSCHQDEYQRTNDPDHAAAGFPTTCQDCHNTNDWDDTNWDHDDFFPIYSGNHRRGRAWTTCDQCHVSPGNYRHFECTECHEHSRGRMDNEHRGIGGYRYESQACFSCHPDGDD